ncbi:MAG: ornithine cyclodeaminase family protein [Acidobacteriota bacterium]
MTSRPSVVVYSEADLRQRVGCDQAALAAVSEAFTWWSKGRAEMPPVMHFDVAGHGDVDIKGAYVAGQDRFAVKIASGFFGNVDLGLPTGSGLMLVLSARTGFCEAVLLDNGYLTDLRTGLAGAVAAQHLAPAQIDTVGVVGSGTQARFQVEALRLVRSFRRLLVWSRQPSHAEAYRREMASRLGNEVEISCLTDLRRLAAESQCLITTTPARAPLLTARDLRPGMHITAVGADLPGKGELSPDLLGAADLLVCDARSQAERLGELQQLAQADGDRPSVAETVELGEILLGRHPGRRHADEISVCDLTGLGTQDTAIARFALSRLGPSP